VRNGDQVTAEVNVVVPEEAGGTVGSESCLWAANATCVGDGTIESPDDGLDFTGITLVDVDNGQRHLVLRQGDTGECLCSRNVPFSLDPDTQTRFFATFPAPPDDVTTMTVEVPNFAAVPGVPLS